MRRERLQKLDRHVFVQQQPHGGLSSRPVPVLVDIPGKGERSTGSRCIDRRIEAADILRGETVGEQCRHQIVRYSCSFYDRIAAADLRVYCYAWLWVVKRDDLIAAGSGEASENVNHFSYQILPWLARQVNGRLVGGAPHDVMADKDTKVRSTTTS
jgi:hypothetical protein